MTLLLTAAEIRESENHHRALHPRASLMGKAGTAVARKAISMLGTSGSGAQKKVLVLAGPGNNGGDAWVAAHELSKHKSHPLVEVLALGEHSLDEPAAQKARDAFERAGGKLRKSWPKAGETSLDLVIDGLFGIGISRAPSGLFADIILACNLAREKSEVLVLAIDVPSGLDADSGVAYAPCIIADETITFIAAKPGLYTGDGPDVAGKISVDSLGVEAADHAPRSTGDETAVSLLDAASVRDLIPWRKRNSHKGHFGNVGIIGGAEGMSGAAVLAARAALHMGAGKVFLGMFDKDRPAFDLLHPEIMVRDARVLAKDESMTTFAVGMGNGEAGVASLLTLLQCGKSLVVDADALNAIATNSSIRAVFQTKPAENGREYWPFIFTPHPGEAARLLGCSTAEVQAQRLSSARRIAQQFSVICVLKGAGTVIARPNGTAVINSSGNPGMASGGMGDALAGMLAALMAQGMNPWDAARLGVYVHGAAADAANHHGMGPLGLTASEVIFEARSLLNAGLIDHHDDEEATSDH